MFVGNCWYVAAWDHEVLAEGFLARTVAGVPLVLWRDAAGRVVVLEDRCCHRGAPLSMGRRERGGDCIRCMYHGLLFDRGGQCIEAPAQQRIPIQAKVRSFAAVESHRWVWVWMGSAESADESLIPDTHWVDDPAWRSESGYLHYDVNYLLVADNLLDFSHLPFLHPTTVGGSTDYAAVLPKIERLARGVRLSKWVAGTEPPAYSARYADLAPGARVDRWMNYEFLVPGVLLMDSGMLPAGTSTPDGHRDGSLAFRGCQALTPETETSTHYFFAHPHNFLLDRPDVTREIHAGIVQAFEEDRAMITAQQRNLLRDPGFRMVPLGVDAALSQFRWIVDHLLAREQGL